LWGRRAQEKTIRGTTGREGDDAGHTMMRTLRIREYLLTAH